MGDTAEVYYVPSFIEGEIAETWYRELLELDSWYQPKLKMYGKEITQSRKIAAYATDANLKLRYSGQTVAMQYTYPPLLRTIQDQVEDHLGVRFNHVMLNLYEDGSVYIGNHRDNIENRVIAAVSLGVPRTFIMTRDDKAIAKRPPRKPNVTTTKAEKPDIPPAKSNGEPSTNSQRIRKRKNDDNTEPFTFAGPSQLKADDSPKPSSKQSWVLASGSLLVMQGETQRYWKHEIPKELKVREGRISLTFRQLVD
ncbi:hypothetical protein B0H34DRAFT_668001 [Crassisporium funariophilum]|nr:hypothetical protein B0H34DRAFT_668001 [Crassisporium funariophilum]